MFYSETLSLSGSSESSSSCSSCDKCNENNGDHGEFGSFRFVSSFPYSGFLVSELLQFSVGQLNSGSFFMIQNYQNLASICILISMFSVISFPNHFKPSNCVRHKGKQVFLCPTIGTSILCFKSSRFYFMSFLLIEKAV